MILERALGLWLLCGVVGLVIEIGLCVLKWSGSEDTLDEDYTTVLMACLAAWSLGPVQLAAVAWNTGRTLRQRQRQRQRLRQRLRRLRGSANGPPRS